MLAAMARIAAELLAKHPFLVDLSFEQLEKLARFGEIESYADGETVVSQGSLGDALYLILGGQVEVFAGQGPRPLAVLKTGEYFGEMSLVEPALRSATVRARGAIEVFRLPHVAVSRVFESDPVTMNRILTQVVRTLSHRLRHSNELVGSVERLSEWLAGSML